MCLERECWVHFATLCFCGKNGGNKDGITSAFFDTNTAPFYFFNFSIDLVSIFQFW